MVRMAESKKHYRSHHRYSRHSPLRTARRLGGRDLGVAVQQTRRRKVIVTNQKRRELSSRRFFILFKF